MNDKIKKTNMTQKLLYYILPIDAIAFKVVKR